MSRFFDSDVTRVVNSGHSFLKVRYILKLLQFCIFFHLENGPVLCSTTKSKCQNGFWKNESSLGSKSCLYSRLWFDLRLYNWLLIHTMFFVFKDALFCSLFYQSKYLISNQNIRLPIKIFSRTVPSWTTPLHTHQWGTLSAPSFRLSNDLKFKRKYL